jgi:hypothetical protein
VASAVAVDFPTDISVAVDKLTHRLLQRSSTVMAKQTIPVTFTADAFAGTQTMFKKVWTRKFLKKTLRL